MGTRFGLLPAVESEALRRAVQRHLWRSPLFLPLLAVVGALQDGAGWLLALVALVLSCYARSRRMVACVVLCSVLAGLQQASLDRQAETFRRCLAERGSVSLEGTVLRKLSSGCILSSSSGIRVALRGDLPYRTGDRIRVTAVARPIEPPAVEGMFDPMEWMKEQGLADDLACVESSYVGHPLSWAAVLGGADRLRGHLADVMMPPGTEGDARRQVLCSLVLGEKGRSEEETLLAFRRSGCLHAFAVSGLHVGIVAAILWLLMRWTCVPLRLSYYLLLLLTGAYVLTTGLSVPAMRAYLMLALMLGALLMRRQVHLLNIWSLAALVILLMAPWQWGNAGFMLSFGVYAVICFGARLCLLSGRWFGADPYIPPRLYSRRERWLGRADMAVRGVVAVSLCAWLVSVPITIWKFHTVNTYGFLSNIAIAFILHLVMLGGLALLLLGWIPFLGPCVEFLALKASGILLSTVSFFSGIPDAYLPSVPPQPPAAMMVVPTGYGNSVCMLGNPGLLIDAGSESACRFLVEPALFHAGFSPSLLLLSQDAESRRGGEALIRSTWPRVKEAAAQEGIASCSYGTGAGEFFLYAAPSFLPRRPSCNASPIVLWKTGKCRVLYIGNASWETWNAMPQEAKQADVAILGRHPYQPVTLETLLEQSGASRVILLPDAESPAWSLPPAVEIIEVQQGKPLLLEDPTAICR